MRFDTIPDASTRVYDGPFYGIRLLAASPGASCVVDRMALPTNVLPAYQAPAGAPFRQIVATGPITLAIADSEFERIGDITSSPNPTPPGGTTLLARWSGATQGVAANGTPAWVPIIVPPGTSGLILWSKCTAGNTYAPYLSLESSFGNVPAHSVAATFLAGLNSPNALSQLVIAPYSRSAIYPSPQSAWLGNDIGTSGTFRGEYPLAAGPLNAALWCSSAGMSFDADLLAVGS